MPNNRKLMWIVRLVFYPVSIGLIVLAWQQRERDEDSWAAGGPPVARLAAPGTTVTLAGATEQRWPMRVELQDGRPVSWAVDEVWLWCGRPRVGQPDYRTSYEQYIYRPRDVVSGRTLRTRREGVGVAWGNGMSATAKVRAEARMGEDGLTGTLRMVAVMNPPVRKRVCRSGPVEFYLTRTNPPA